MKPEFLCIGTQKAGTSWLYEMIKFHPDLWVTPIKEIHYYYYKEHGTAIGNLDYCLSSSAIEARLWRNNLARMIREYRKTMQAGSVDWFMKFLFGVRDDKWYESLFEEAGDRVAGEFSATYSLLSRDTVESIYNALPECKIILMVRNPIDRAFSSLKMELSFSGMKVGDLTDDEIFEFLRHEGIRKGVDYPRMIDKWKKYQDKGNVFIGFFEQIVDDPIGLLVQVCDFLGVDTSWVLNNSGECSRIVNQGQIGVMSADQEIEAAKIFYPVVLECQKVLGSYATCWLEKTERLIR